GEGQDLESEDVDAHRLGRPLVLTDGHPTTPDAGVVEVAEDDDDEDDEGDEDEVVVAGARDLDAEDGVGLPEVEPEEVQVRDGVDAVGPAGDHRARLAVEVEHRQPEDLTEGEGDDGEI